MRADKNSTDDALVKGVYTEAGGAGSFSSAGQLYREARRRGLHVSKASVQKFSSAYRAESLFRRRKRRPVVTFAVALNQKWQLDLGFYSRPYRGFSAFLVCVDVLSRKCYLRVLKGKTSATVAAALLSILSSEEGVVPPAYIVTDRGTEFAGAPFQDLLARFSIHHYYANPPYKASLAERVIGALKTAEGRLREAQQGGSPRNWPARLHLAVQAYNDSVHSRTGLPPNKVTLDNANAVFRRLYHPWADLRPRQLDKEILSLGTAVRLVLHNRGLFAKANTPRNSAEVFTIGRIRLHPRQGVKYKLFTVEGRLPVAGTFNASELVPIQLPQA